MAVACPCGCGRQVKGIHLRGAATGYQRAGVIRANYATLMAHAEKIPGLVDEESRSVNRLADERGKAIQVQLEQHLHGQLTRTSSNMLEINKELKWYEGTWQKILASAP